MAKNLKLNVKNTQLAAALQLNKTIKPAAVKKKKEEPSAEAITEAPTPVEESAPIPAPAPFETPLIQEASKPPPEEEEEKQALPVHRAQPSFTPRQSQPYVKKTYPPGPYRPSYPPSSRPSYPPSGRPPYPSSGRPSYPPSRPPFRPAPTSLPPKPLSTPKPTTEREIRRPGTKEYRDLKPQKKFEPGKTFDSRDKQGLRDSEGEGWRKRRPSHKAFRQIQEEITIRPKQLSVRIPITVKDLASEMKLKASELISKLFMQGVVITLNDYLADETTIQLLGHEFDCAISIDTKAEERLRITDKTIKQEIQAVDAASLITRPPVVAFMGHVDHGKTSLIDAIRKTNVASGEAGAITQHIGAFRCHTAVGDITILDTPGHEAFSSMRSRGADITDIVVLVIAGDEGVRTQTLEAIQQAQAAQVPIVVAINKCDKPNFNAETIYRQLADQTLLPEAWGGTTITVNCSAVTGAGIKELLEMLALQSEVLELKASLDMRARGTVVESELHKGMGPVATILVQNGTLHINDSVVFAQHWARIKTMQDEYGKDLEKATPSTPVKITGISGVPAAGSEFIVVKNEREARSLAEERSTGQKNISLLQNKRAGIEGLLQQEASKAEKKILNLIVRADVQGSVEALKNSLLKIASTKADVNIISQGVGEISESDIQLAAASKAVVIGFHTKVESHAESLIKKTKVTVHLHEIIYHAIDDVKELMLALLDKIPQESDTGEALVKTTFKASQLGVIAGCQVTEGTIRRGAHIRVLRDNQVVWKGSISSLKRVKEDVREVSKGMECGIFLQNFNDVKEGDRLQAYEITYLEQTL